MEHSNKFSPIGITTFAAVCAFLMATPLHQQSLAQSSEPSSALNIKSISPTSDLLDGLRFKAGIIKAENGSGNALEDTLIFSEGNFSSIVCKRYNFTAAPYWIRTDGETIHFLVELNSPTDGKMIWKGSVTGDKLDGTMRWTRKRWYWTIDVEHKIQGNVDIGNQSISASGE